MKLNRLPHDPSALIDFFQEGLEALGAVCDRSWHDRLQVIAEGPAARPWNTTGEFIDVEIHFRTADQTSVPDARKEVFPGCPLTFRLTEQLQSANLSLERVRLHFSDQAKPPTAETAERLWHAQMPGTTRWNLESPFLPDWHFSLLTLIRCEVQAIDQHWFVHRLAISLPDGQRDENLASVLDFAQAVSSRAEGVNWPVPSLPAWHDRICQALEEDLAVELTGIRQRQAQYLRRELERVDAYFQSYGHELAARQQRSHTDASKTKIQQRLAAAQAEHQRRRHDQIQRHEIRVIPHLDALLFLAEPAWKARISFSRRNEPQRAQALFVPRSRKWIKRATET
jgi:hypothetical protein